MQLNQSPDYDVTEGNYDRPLSITLIAILLIIGGGILVITNMIAFRQLNDASEAIGVSSALLQGSIVFLGLLGIAAGVGSWLGKKWGWWLAIFYFAYAVARNVNTLLLISDTVNTYGVSGQSYYIRESVKLLWNGLIFLFLLRSETVNDYFATGDIRKWKAASIVFGIVIAIFAVVTIATLL